MRARFAALILSLALIVGAIVIAARGYIDGQTFNEIIWITIDAENLMAAFGDVITAKNVLVLCSQKYVNEKLRGYPSSNLLFSGSTQNSLHFLVRSYNSLCNNITWYIGIREGRFISREVQGSTMGLYRQVNRWGVAAVFPVWVNVPRLSSGAETGCEHQCRQDWINKRALGGVRIPDLPFDKFSLLTRITDQDVSERGYSSRGQRRYESIMGVGPVDEQGWRTYEKSPKLFGALYAAGGYFFLIWGSNALFLPAWQKLLGLILVVLGFICIVHGFEALTR
jgi:hypothetical protein